MANTRTIRLSPCVAGVTRELEETGEPVTASRIVSMLLKIHPEFGGGTRRDFEFDVNVGTKVFALEWLAAVGASLKSDVDFIHTRLMVLAIARIDADAKRQLGYSFLRKLQLEIHETAAELFID